MNLRFFVASAFLVFAGRAIAFQPPMIPATPAPTIHTVAEWNTTRGELVCESIVSESVPVRRFVTVERDGVKKQVIVTEFVQKSVKRQSTLSIKDCEFMTADGKQLTAEEAKRPASIGSLVVVAGYGAKVDPTYLKILKPETLVVLPSASAILPQKP
jgi:hypothetical protein